MFFTPTQNANARSLSRRLRAMAATLLFALCVLVASAPHRHAGDGLPRGASSLHGVSAARATTLQSVAASCALCDWLNAPTLPAAPPILPPVVATLRRPVLVSSTFLPRLLGLTLSRSSSRAPPAVV